MSVIAAVPVLATLIVGLSSLASGQSLPPGGSFVDDDFNTHEGFIEAIAAQDFTAGCDLIRYCPTRPVSRAQVASFLARALDLPEATRDWFGDDAGSIHEDNINRIADAGITLGRADGTFDPDGGVRRDQMASFPARALALPPAADDYFGDDAGNTHEAAINAVAEAGITLGCDSTGTLYCPLVEVRRDQMASFLGRGLGLVEVSLPPPVVVPVLSMAVGDTIRVQVGGESEALRLIGIDSPEPPACLADEATARMSELVARRDVRIDTDTSDRDRFDRLLRYVFVDGQFVNEELVRDGLAEAVRFPPDTRLAEILEAAQEDAQADRVGVITECCG